MIELDAGHESLDIHEDARRASLAGEFRNHPPTLVCFHPAFGDSLTTSLHLMFYHVSWLCDQSRIPQHKRPKRESAEVTRERCYCLIEWGVKAVRSTDAAAPKHNLSYPAVSASELRTVPASSNG